VRQQACQGPQPGRVPGIVADPVVMVGMAGKSLTMKAWHGLNPSGDDELTLAAGLPGPKNNPVALQRGNDDGIILDLLAFLSGLPGKEFHDLVVHPQGLLAFRVVGDQFLFDSLAEGALQLMALFHPLADLLPGLKQATGPAVFSPMAFDSKVKCSLPFRSLVIRDHALNGRGQRTGLENLHERFEIAAFLKMPHCL
jgi:hypothetical protein